MSKLNKLKCRLAGHNWFPFKDYLNIHKNTYYLVDFCLRCKDMKNDVNGFYLMFSELKMPKFEARGQLRDLQ